MSMQSLFSAPIAMKPLPAGSAKKDTPAKIQQAATDFEALLLAQMMKSAREASGGGLTAEDGDDSDANSTMIELGEQSAMAAMPEIKRWLATPVAAHVGKLHGAAAPDAIRST